MAAAAVPTVAQFRTTFPEFANTEQYPEAVVAFWLEVASLMLNRCVWGRIWTLALQLFAAHNLVLERQALNSAAIGQPPGVMTGPVNSKSVGPASISYATNDAVVPGASHWNMTTYGVRLAHWMQLYGARPIQLGMGISPPFNIGAWPGPAPWPLPSGTGFAS